MRRFLVRSVIIVVVLTATVVAAFRLSPWPSVAIIAYAFSRGGQASEAALAKHVGVERGHHDLGPQHTPERRRQRALLGVHGGESDALMGVGMSHDGG